MSKEFGDGLDQAVQKAFTRPVPLLPPLKAMTSKAGRTSYPSGTRPWCCQSTTPAGTTLSKP